MTTSPALAARREARIRTHVEAENNHDVSATLATMTEAPLYDVPGLGADIAGAEAVGAFLEGFFKAFPSIRSEAIGFYHADNAVAVEVRTTGTHTGEFLGVAGNGKPIDVWSMAVFTFDGDRITGEKVCSNDLLLLHQVQS